MDLKSWCFGLYNVAMRYTVVGRSSMDSFCTSSGSQFSQYLSCPSYSMVEIWPPSILFQYIFGNVKFQLPISYTIRIVFELSRKL